MFANQSTLQTFDIGFHFGYICSMTWMKNSKPTFQTALNAFGKVVILVSTENHWILILQKLWWN